VTPLDGQERNFRVSTLDGQVLDEVGLPSVKAARRVGLQRARILGERVLVRRFREGWEDYCICLPEGVVLTCAPALRPTR